MKKKKPLTRETASVLRANAEDAGLKKENLTRDSTRFFGFLPEWSRREFTTAGPE